MTGLVLLLAWTMATINKQGGVKIVLWRVRGKRGFLLTMIEPDKKVFRRPLPMSLVHNSTHRFSFQGGEYFTGGPDETIYAFGMPNWVYVRGDCRPLPLNFKGEQMSATKVHSAFVDDSIERFNGLKQKISRISLKTLTYLNILIFVVACAGALYAYYYGLNANCGLHTRACPVP